MQTERMCEFFKMAQKQGSDLVITHGASVPLAVVKKIICGEFIPEARKLWCLGGEGNCERGVFFVVDMNGGKKAENVLVTLMSRLP